MDEKTIVAVPGGFGRSYHNAVMPAETTPKPQDPPKAGGVSLAIVGAAVAALGAAGIITRRKRS